MNKYPDNAPVTHIGNGIYSYLSPAQLKELRRCVAIGYPKHARRSTYRMYACKPEIAIKFMQHADFKA